MGGVPGRDASGHDRLTVTVVIPTRNRGSMIQDCLRSVLALDRRDIRIMVIDQSTGDETRLVVEAETRGDPRVAVVRSDSVGVSEARNLAVELSSTDVIAFADDDCVVEPGWLDALMREFDDPRVVGVYGRIVPLGFITRNGSEIVFKDSPERQVFDGESRPGMWDMEPAGRCEELWWLRSAASTFVSALAQPLRRQRISRARTGYWRGAAGWCTPPRRCPTTRTGAPGRRGERGSARMASEPARSS